MTSQDSSAGTAEVISIHIGAIVMGTLSNSTRRPVQHVICAGKVTDIVPFTVSGSTSFVSCDISKVSSGQVSGVGV